MTPYTFTRDELAGDFELIRPTVRAAVARGIVAGDTRPAIRRTLLRRLPPAFARLLADYPGASAVALSVAAEVVDSELEDAFGTPSANRRDAR